MRTKIRALIKICGPFEPTVIRVLVWLPGLVTVNSTLSWLQWIVGQSSVFIDGLIIIHLEYSVPQSFTFFFYKESISPNCSEQEAQAEFNQDRSKTG